MQSCQCCPQLDFCKAAVFCPTDMGMGMPLPQGHTVTIANPNPSNEIAPFVCLCGAPPTQEVGCAIVVGKGTGIIVYVLMLWQGGLSVVSQIFTENERGIGWCCPSPLA